MTSPTEHTCTVNGLEMCYFKWSQATKTTVLLLHATGFHARCWDRVVSALDSQVNVIALDLRGHGRTEKQAPYDWGTISQDVVNFIDQLDLSNLLIVGHSMGGRCALYASANRKSRVNSLLLVDPVILPPEEYSRDNPISVAGPENHPVANRKNHFISADEMFGRFKDRAPFSLWNPNVLRDYCEYGLIKDGDHFALACPPLVEAAVYTESMKTPTMDLISDTTQPTIVLRAEKRDPSNSEVDFSKSPTWPDLANALTNGRDLYHPELTHFIPMQRPEIVAQHIDSLLDR